jgi:hypothetical protein
MKYYFLLACLCFSLKALAQSDTLIKKVAEQDFECRYSVFKIDPVLYANVYLYTHYKTRWFGRSILRPFEIRSYQLNIYKAWRTKDFYVVCFRTTNSKVNELMILDRKFNPQQMVHMEPWVNTMKEIEEFLKMGKLDIVDLRNIDQVY